MSLTKISALVAATFLALGFTVSANAESPVIKLGQTDAQKMESIYDSLKEKSSAAADHLDLSMSAGVVVYAIDRAGVSAEGSINLGKGVRIGCEGEYTLSDSNGTEAHESMTCFGQLKLTKMVSLRLGTGETQDDTATYETTYIKSIIDLKDEASNLNLQVEVGAVRNVNKDDDSDEQTQFVLGLKKVLF